MTPKASANTDSVSCTVATDVANVRVRPGQRGQVHVGGQRLQHHEAAEQHDEPGVCRGRRRRGGRAHGKLRAARARLRSCSASATPLPRMIAMPTTDQPSGNWANTT